MLFTKEYPATHSMATSWYMIDDDGNVAIMDFNDNGPLPFLAAPDELINSLVFGRLEEEIPEVINLTEEQITLLCEKEIEPNIKYLFYENPIKIDTNREEKFLNYVHKHNDKAVCLHKESGLYYLSANKEEKYQELIDNKIILNIFLLKDFRIDENFNEETNDVDFIFSCQNIPYYIYAQPYWTNHLQKRLNIPTSPIHETQLPDIIRNRAIRIPGSFANLKEIQIAQLSNSVIQDISSNTKIIDGLLYDLLPIPQGCAFCLIDVENKSKDSFSDSLPPDNPNLSFQHRFPLFIILSPIFGERRAYDAFEKDYPEVLNRAIWFPFEVEKDEEKLIELCDYCQPYMLISLENRISEKVKKIILDNFSNIQIITCKKVLSKKKDKINNILKKSYRGKEQRLTYSEEEMNELIKKGIAKKLG